MGKIRVELWCSVGRGRDTQRKTIEVDEEDYEDRNDMEHNLELDAEQFAKDTVEHGFKILD